MIIHEKLEVARLTGTAPIFSFFEP